MQILYQGKNIVAWYVMFGETDGPTQEELDALGCGLGGVKSYRKNKDCPKKAPFFLWQFCFYCYFIVRYMVASVCAVSMMPPPINPSP